MQYITWGAKCQPEIFLQYLNDLKTHFIPNLRATHSKVNMASFSTSSGSKFCPVCF